MSAIFVSTIHEPNNLPVKLLHRTPARRETLSVSSHSARKNRRRAQKRKRKKEHKDSQGNLATVPDPIEPRELLRAHLLERGDLSVVLEREPNVVEAVHEAVLAELVNGELELLAGRPPHDLVWEVDLNLETRARVLLELGDLGFRENDGEETVLVAVVVEAGRKGCY